MKGSARSGGWLDSLDAEPSGPDEPGETAGPTGGNSAIAIRVTVVDRAGEEHACDFPAGGSLMEALRDNGFDVAAICGGMCSCATCHVYVADDWFGRLPPGRDDEHDLVGELQHCRETSRLSCQIEVGEDLDGLRVTLAPEE